MGKKRRRRDEQRGLERWVETKGEAEDYWKKERNGRGREMSYGYGVAR